MVVVLRPSGRATIVPGCGFVCASSGIPFNVSQSKKRRNVIENYYQLSICCYSFLKGFFRGAGRGSLLAIQPAPKVRASGVEASRINVGVQEVG
jgi:hypothetical protein